MIRALSHICIDVVDLDETERFYCEQLGLSVHFNYIRRGERFGIMLRVDDRSYIEAFRLAEKPLEQAAGIKHLCFEVDNIDDTETLLRERGVDCFNKKQASDGSWALWCKDPSGISIEFNAYDEQSAVHTREDRQIYW